MIETSTERFIREQFEKFINHNIGLTWETGIAIKRDFISFPYEPDIYLQINFNNYHVRYVFTNGIQYKPDYLRSIFHSMIINLAERVWINADH